MYLVHRFYLLTLPAILVFVGLVVWIDAREADQRVAAFADQFVTANLEKVLLLANNPVFLSYFDHQRYELLPEAGLDRGQIEDLFARTLALSRAYGHRTMVLALHARDGRLVAEVRGDPDAAPFSALAEPWRPVVSVVEGDRHRTTVALGEDTDRDGTLGAAEAVGFLHAETLMPLERIRARERADMVQDITIMVGGLTVISILVLWAGGSVARPIRRLSDQARTVVQGNLDQPFAAGSSIAELDLLSRALNTMVEALGRKQDEIRRYQTQLEGLVDERTASLRRTQESLGNAQRLARLGSYELALDTGAMWWSDELVQIYGPAGTDDAPPDRDALLAGVHAADRERVAAAVAAALDDGTPFNLDHRIVRADGSERAVHHQGEVSRDARGRPVRLTGTLQDISDRKRLETLLAENLGFQRTLVDNIPNPIFYTTPDGTYVGCNKAFEEWFGMSRTDLFGLTIADLLPAELAPELVRVHQEVDRALAHQPGSRAYEAMMRTRDGGERQTIVTKATYFNAAGEVRGIVGVILDITERKRAEEALQRSEAALTTQAAELKRSNEELAQFAYVASHDLREPLRMVNSYMTLLSRRYAAQLDDPAKEFIGFAMDGARRMDRLIGDLLEYSRVGRKGKPPAPVPLRSIIDAALGNLRLAIAESAAAVTVTGDLPAVLADDQELIRLFQNLIGNAVKYRAPDRTPEVTITVGWATAGWTPAGWADAGGPDGNMVAVSVADNGIGIAPEHFERIFMIFQRLHPRGDYDGTGIGLAICKKIVERHGGRLWVESTPGQGSAFHFTLPPAPRDAGS